MNTHHSFLLLSTFFILFSCASGNDSSESQSSVSENELTNEMLRKAAEGFTALGVFKGGYESLSYSYNYVQVSAKKKEFLCDMYESTTKEPTMDKKVASYRYVPQRSGFYTYLCQEELGLDNEIHYYPVSSGSSYVDWNYSGFGNCFNTIHASAFVKNDAGEYVMKIEEDDDGEYMSSLGPQLTGVIGLTLASFKLTVKDGKLDKYYATFKPIESSYGNYNSEIQGEFIFFGEDVIEELSPVEGNEDQDFKTAITNLKKQNYHLSVSLSSMRLEVDVEDGKNVLYDIYNSKDIKSTSYGYYQKTASAAQGMMKIKDNVYEDGDELQGHVSSLLPTFNLSSLFFNKKEEDGVKIYTLKENITATPYYTDYGNFAGDTAGNLTISIYSDKVVIENELRLSTEKFTYSNIGEVDGLIANLKEDQSSLTWSDILVNQVAENTILYQSITKEELDAIPTFGDKHILVELDASYNKAKPVIALSFDTYDEGEALQQEYLQKLKDNGFTEGKTSSKGNYFTKTIQENGNAVTVGVLVYLAADYFKTTQLLIYPSIVN